MATDTFEVVRTGRIDAPPATVQGYLDDFHRWQEWSPWEGMDPDQQRTFGGPEKGVGATYEWKGNRKVGEGRMEVTESSAERVVVDLRFIKPFRSNNTATFELAGSDDGTEVTWRMVGPRTFMTKVMGIFKSMDSMIGPDFERGLSQLKAAAES